MISSSQPIIDGTIVTDHLQVDLITLPPHSKPSHLQESESLSFVGYLENGSSLQIRNRYLCWIDRGKVQCRPSDGQKIVADRILTAIILPIHNHKIIFVVTETGTGLFLTITDEEKVSLVGNQPSLPLTNLSFDLASILNGYLHLHFDPLCQLLLIQVNRSFAILKVDCNDDGEVAWSVALAATHLMDRTLEALLPPLTIEDNVLSIWSTGDKSDVYVVHADHSSMVTFIPLSDPLSRYTRETSHTQSAFLTALSTCHTHSSISISADALGTLTIWVYELMDEEDEEQGHSWVELFTNDTCCNKYRITTLLLEEDPLRVYIGDDRGMVSIASFSIKAQSLHILHELRLFPLYHAPTFITFTIIQPQKYRIRAYSNSCGEGVEVIVHRSTAAVTRLWPETLALQSPSISSAVVLPDFQMVIVADWSGSMHVCDLQDHGQIIVSFMLPLDQCLTITATCTVDTTSNSKIIRVVSGHRGGEVCMSTITIASSHQSAIATATTTARTNPKDDSHIPTRNEAEIHKEEDEENDPQSGSEEESSRPSSTNSRGNSRYSRQSSARLVSQAHRNTNRQRLQSVTSNKKEAREEEDEEEEDLAVFDLLQQQQATDPSNNLEHQNSITTGSIDSFSLQRLNSKRLPYPQLIKEEKDVKHNSQILSSSSIMSVSDLFFSSQGLHALVIHARKHLVLYALTPLTSAKEESAAVVVNSCIWGEGVSNITNINSTQQQLEDRLWLAIQQPATKSIILLDALQLKVLTEIHMPSPGPSHGIQASVFWDHIEENNMRVLQGLCTSYLSRWFVLDEQSGLKSISQNLFSSRHHAGVCEEQVIGLESFSPTISTNSSSSGLGEQAPIVVAWSLKNVILLRLQLPSSSTATQQAVAEERNALEVTRVKQCSVMSSYTGSGVKVVTAKALRVVPWIRNHRAVVVLSNGFAITLHL